MKFILLLFFIIMIGGCSSSSDDSSGTDKIEYQLSDPLTCLRWIDRDLYLANQDPTNSSNNNEFHKTQLISILEDLQLNTRLGNNYFRVKNVDEGLLSPIRPSGLKEEETKSFILIWDDTKFNDFASKYFGGINELPDQNAITVVSPIFKRKFYIILRASCFESSSQCVNNMIGENVSYSGLSAIIARQFGFLLRLPPISCDTSENNVMCPSAKNEQWNSENKGKFYKDLTDQLSIIEGNPNFYDDVEISANCLQKPWMDQRITLGCPFDGSNNIFDFEIYFDLLEELSQSTLLGDEYFDINYMKDNCAKQSDIPIDLEQTERGFNDTSFSMIWEDSVFNSFINENNINLIDPNAYLQVNAAKKSNFSLIFRRSCFGTFEENCDSGNGGISIDGTKALIARQFGLMVGMEIADCSSDADNVMCSDLPSDYQWRNSYRCKDRMDTSKCQFLLEECLLINAPEICLQADGTGSVQESVIIHNRKEQFINEFNNYLELIGNKPDFYDQYVLPADDSKT